METVGSPSMTSFTDSSPKKGRLPSPITTGTRSTALVEQPQVEALPGDGAPSGGRHMQVGEAPDDPFVVLADPDGNELCVIEPGKNFLADTGYLGEVTCDGTREGGVLGATPWPLVWDQNVSRASSSISRL
jgi:hypothetical protein